MNDSRVWHGYLFPLYGPILRTIVEGLSAVVSAGKDDSTDGGAQVAGRCLLDRSQELLVRHQSPGSGKVRPVAESLANLERFAIDLGNGLSKWASLRFQGHDRVHERFRRQNSILRSALEEGGAGQRFPLIVTQAACVATEETLLQLDAKARGFLGLPSCDQESAGDSSDGKKELAALLSQMAKSGTEAREACDRAIDELCKARYGSGKGTTRTTQIHGPLFTIERTRREIVCRLRDRQGQDLLDPTCARSLDRMLGWAGSSIACALRHSQRIVLDKPPMKVATLEILEEMDTLLRATWEDYEIWKACRERSALFERGFADTDSKRAVLVGIVQHWPRHSITLHELRPFLRAVETFHDGVEELHCVSVRMDDFEWQQYGSLSWEIASLLTRKPCDPPKQKEPVCGNPVDSSSECSSDAEWIAEPKFLPLEDDFHFFDLVETSPSRIVSWFPSHFDSVKSGLSTARGLAERAGLDSSEFDLVESRLDLLGRRSAGLPSHVLSGVVPQAERLLVQKRIELRSQAAKSDSKDQARLLKFAEQVEEIRVRISALHSHPRGESFTASQRGVSR